MRRYHFVDLLRGFAAIAVLICHYRWFYARYPGDWRNVPLPAEWLLWPVYGYGGFAVQLFWILSGFVFAIAYGRFGTGISIREFWLRRFSRLYPLHLVTLLAVASIQLTSQRMFGTWQVYADNDLPHFILHLFFASNWFTMDPSFNGPVWSVSIEEIVYFAFLLYLKKTGLNLPAAILLVLSGLLVTAATGSLITQCASLFFAGVAIGIVAPVHSRWPLPLGLAGSTMVLLAYAALALTDLETWIPALLIYAGTPALLLVFIGLDYRFSLPRRLRWIGAITYAVYMLHMPILMVLRMSVGIVPLWLFAALVIGLSIPTYYLFEAPSRKWILAKFSRDRPRIASARDGGSRLEI